MLARKTTLLLCAGIVAISGAVTSLASAADLNPAERLRKMSLRIRGIAPSDNEFQNLAEAIATNQAQNFLEAKANDYAMARWADQKLADRIFEDFRFQFEPRSDESEPDVVLANVGSDSHQRIRAALQEGQSLPQILTGTKVEELVRVSTMRDRIRRNGREGASEPAMRQFAARATAMGYDMKSIDGVKRALLAYQADRQAFEGKLPIPADHDARFRALSEVVRRAMNRFGDRTKLDLEFAARAVEKLGKSYTGENYSDLSEEDQRAFYRLFSLMDISRKNDKWQIVVGVTLPSDSTHYVQIRDQDLQIAACAFAADSGFKELRYNEADIRSICGTLSPFPLPEFSKNLELTARMYNGFFDTAEGFKYLSENFDSIAREFPRLADSYPPPPSTGIPAIARSYEFQNRYFQTRYSQAAAYFRIFLCDEMQIVALVDKSKKTQSSLSSFFETDGAKTTSKSTDEVSKDHVKGDCVGCHRKLDPIKALFDRKAFSADNSSEQVASVPTAKKLEFVYDDFDGAEHRVSVADGNSMLQTLTEQPQFARCQVRKLWNWVIGEDVPLDAKREGDLLRVYKETDASPKKILAYLALRPEFSTDSTFSETPNFSSVRHVFQRCNSCHAAEGTIPSFTALPFGFGGADAEKNRREHFKYLKDIAIKTDLVHDGADAKMPPLKAGWSISAQDRDAISRWIMGGALDETSKPTLTKAESEEILREISAAKRAQLAEPRRPMATFRPTWRRYFEAYDLPRTLQQKTKLNFCAKAARRELAIGLKDVTTGKPVTDQPSNAFRDFYSRCLVDTYRILKDQAEYGHEPATHAIGLSQLTAAGLNVRTVLWQEVPDRLRMKTYDSLIETYIGPGVLTTNRANRLKTKMSISTDVILAKKPNARAIEVAISALNVLANDDEFLTH